MSLKFDINYVPNDDLGAMSLTHTSPTRPQKTIPVKGLESFIGIANLLHVPPALNLKEVMGTTRPDGMWSKEFDGNLFPRIMKFFTKYPGKLYKLLTEPLLITPEGDSQDGRKSLPNVSFYVAFIRQLLGDESKPTWWVDPITYSRDITKVSVLDSWKLAKEVKNILLPSMKESGVTFNKPNSSDKLILEDRDILQELRTNDLRPLILACYHGWANNDTIDAFARAGFPRNDFVDVNVTGTKGFDSDLVKNGINLANVVEQRAIYDKPEDSRFGALIYSADVFAGFQIMMPGIFDGLDLMQQVLVSCYRRGQIDINDPVDPKYFVPMMKTYVDYLKSNEIQVSDRINRAIL